MADSVYCIFYPVKKPLWLDFFSDELFLKSSLPSLLFILFPFVRSRIKTQKAYLNKTIDLKAATGRDTHFQICTAQTRINFFVYTMQRSIARTIREKYLLWKEKKNKNYFTFKKIKDRKEY